MDALQLAHQQAEDEGLWFNAKTAAEAYLQAALRKLHAAVEAAPVAIQGEAATTPAAVWRQKGEPDPHGKRYDCERAALCMGDLTDDELANGAFLNYDRRPSMEDLIARKPGVHMPIAWMTAVKDRIRWLSRKLEESLAPPAAPIPPQPNSVHQTSAVPGETVPLDLTAEVMALADRFAETLGRADSRAWAHLLGYAPKPPKPASVKQGHCRAVQCACNGGAGDAECGNWRLSNWSDK